MVCQHSQQHTLVGICEGVLLPCYSLPNAILCCLRCLPPQGRGKPCEGVCCCTQYLAVSLQAWWRALITRLFCCCSKMVGPQ